MSVERRQDLTCGAVLLLIWLAVSIPRLTGPIDLRWDASAYYVLGTALAEGKGYRLLNEPGEIKTVQYPPLVPLIVAVHQWLMGTSDFFEVGWRLRIVYFVLSGIYLLAVYVLARQLHAPIHALLIGAITGLSFYSFFYPSETLYTELPFALVSILFLLCQRRSDQPVYAVASGILVVAAYLLRTAAIALLAAWVAESLIRRRCSKRFGRQLPPFQSSVASSHLAGHIEPRIQPACLCISARAILLFERDIWRKLYARRSVPPGGRPHQAWRPVWQGHAQRDSDSPGTGRKLLVRQGIWNVPLGEAGPQTGHSARP